MITCKLIVNREKDNSFDVKFSTTTENNDTIIYKSNDYPDVKTDHPELYIIFDILQKIDSKIIHIHTNNLYVKNVLHEWIHIWKIDNFEYSLIKETFTENKNSRYRKRIETVIKGKRPNSDILKKISNLLSRKEITMTLEYDSKLAI